MSCEELELWKVAEKDGSNETILNKKYNNNRNTETKEKKSHKNKKNS